MLERRPLLAAALASVAFLAIGQAVFLLVRNRAYFGPEMAAGVTKASVVVAAATFLLLVPIAALGRRWLPSWRAGDRLGASWAMCFGLAAALLGWTIAAYLTAAPVVPRGLGVGIDLLAALTLGVTASALRPRYPWVRAWAIVAVALVLLLFVPYPRMPEAPAEARPAAAVADAARPDVVLVSIDTLRADHLGVYGRSPTLTPGMDRIAREGVVFTRALAASPWTTPSVASLLTGLPVTRHDAGRPLGSGLTFLRSPLDGRYTTLAERFAAAGYRTRGVVANGFLHPESGMAQGFEEFVTPFSGAMMASFMRDLPLTRLIVALTPPKSWGDYRAQGVTDAALRFLDESDPRPLFLWVHYIDPHTPFQADPALLDPAVLSEMVHQTHPPTREDGTVVGEVFAATDLVRAGTLWLGPRDRERLRQYYAGEVAYTDTHVGRLFEALRARRARRPVAAALTADHGEEFWDHGHFEHGHDYYREVTWVPLVFWGAGTPEGRTINSVAGLVDVAPSLTELAGLPVVAPAAPDEGRSLVPLWSGRDEGEAAPPRFAGGNLYGLPAALVEGGPWRFILRANDAQELYDVASDPQERRNVAFEHPLVAERLRRALEPQLAALLHTGDVSAPRAPTPEQLEALRALGYAR
ncbi:MAG TPA: sulfatase-like hydrolase/transferase [Vicinamibacteria bacterium]|nr:sulfatase-like hydrolase/transferase [Vicinamibacteria bacterium]